MPCEHYKDALIDVAASGAALQGELRAHLDECASCRAAFAEEQSLFSAIDSGLHASANTEIPPSLLPRVDARLDEHAAVGRGWVTNRFVLVGAAAVVVALLTFRTVRRTNVELQPPETVANTSSFPSAVQSPQNTLSSVPSVKIDSSSQPRAARVASSVRSEAVASRISMPEVLVSSDQEVLLVSYTKQWRRHKHAPLVAGEVGDSTLEPLQVSPIQIAQLDVKPLAAENSQ